MRTHRCLFFGCRSSFFAAVLLVTAYLSLATCGKDSPTKPTAPEPTPPPPPPPAPVATRIEITPSSVTLNSIGQTAPLTARVLDQNNAVLSGAAVVWSSSLPGVATVSAQGLVTAVANGNTQITARSGNVSASVTVIISQSATKVVIEPTSANLMAIGQTVQLTASVLDENGQPVADAEVTWSSSDAGVASVSGQGLVTAVAIGTAQITASAGSASASVPVTVMAAPRDREALVALYNSTNGPNWTNSTNWLTDAPLNTWYGVTTNDRGEVTDLILRENNLGGTIPSGLGQLHSLFSLDLAGNHLTDAIPSELGHLRIIRTLRLSENSLTGAIPPELGQLTHLILLSLANNELTGVIPPELGQLRNLKNLNFGWNALTGSIPPELGQLSNLTILSLRYSLLTGAIPPELGQLRNLEEMFIDSNELSGSIPSELGQLTNLRRLVLSNNTGLSGPLPSTMTELANLQLFHIDKTLLCVRPTVEFQDWFRTIAERRGSTCSDQERDALIALYNRTDGPNWTNNSNWYSFKSLNEWHGVITDAEGKVVTVDLEDNNLNGSLPGSLGDLTSLTALNLSFNTALTGTLPPTFTSLGLEELLLEGTQLCAPSDDGFQAWLEGISQRNGADCIDTRRDFYPLTVLYDSTNGPEWTNQSNWLTGAALDTWYGVTTNELGEVTGLDLQENNLAGTIPPELAQFDKLETLHLGTNELTGNIPSELVELQNLSYLYLGWNRLTGSVPSELVHLENLTFLHLGYNRLTGIVSTELVRLRDLRELNLADNQLTGTIPAELGQLGDLEYLKLYFNQLGGAIPPELGQLGNLHLLNLSGNQLTGFIPPELGQLGSLKALGLSGNELTGTIPSELGQLGNLDGWLDLSENLLTGPIPYELGQLGSLRELDLRGNQLTGTIPPEFGKLGNLESLRLSFNQLEGNIPNSVGEMASLKTLAVMGNAGMSGTLPPGLVRLNLDGLLLSNTRLCPSPDLGFQDWLRTIPNLRVSSRCNLDPGESTVYLTQATQSLEQPVPIVAGDEALLRVFLTTNEDIIGTMPPMRARFYQGEAEIHALDIPEQAVDIPQGIDEGDLSASANARVPGSVLLPGLEMVIEIDPDGLSEASSGVVRRLPAMGRTSVDVRYVPPLELTLVPFLWTEDPNDRSVLAETAGLSAQSDLFRPTHDLLPVDDLVVNVRDPVWTTTELVLDNGDALLRETTALRIMDGASGQPQHYYMGLLEVGGGQAAGIGSTVSVSVLDDLVIAHELGHNMNLFHAPCGGAAGPDPNYPYPDGSTGSWGYDLLADRLVGPSTSDLMSYCHPQWISEYHFNRAMAYRLSQVQAPLLAASLAPAARSLLLWGGVGVSGELVFEPAFVVDAPQMIPEAGGPYEITGEDRDGRVLFNFSFRMTEVIDGEGGLFVFVLPGRGDWPRRLSRITLSGPEGVVTLGEEDDRSAAILLDSATGQVGGLLRDWPAAGISDVSARRVLPEPGLDVVISRGIPDRNDW